MADELKIVASLDVPKSVQEINKDIPKLQGQSKHLKIIADLDPKLSIKNIQATLNKMNNNANIKIGIDTSGLNSVRGATQNITNSLKNVQTQAQQTASAVNNVKSELMKLDTTAVENTSFEAAFVNKADNIIDLEKTLANARQELSKFGKVDFSWLKDIGGNVSEITAKITDATGVVEKFHYAFNVDAGNFSWIGSSGTNSGVEKLISDIKKAEAAAQKALAGFNNKSMGLFNQTDVYKKALEASQNITNFDDIAKFNNAMAELEAHYQKITSYTRSGGKSLNPFINAVNDMAGMEEQIKRIKASADGLQNKSKSLIGNLGSLNRLADNVNKYAVGTEEWGQAYEKLKNKIAQVNDQIKTAKVEQKTTDSFAQKQQNMYSVIEQRMKQINQLKIQQLSTDEETSRIIQEQINSYTNQINGIKGTMSKYKYGDKTLDNEVEKLKTELDYKYRIAQSEKENRVQQQSNNELLKFQTDTLREINAEYEKIVANKKAMASSKSEENKSIYANRIAESEKIIANDMEMLKDANLLTEEINQQVASKRQYVAEQEKIVANTEQLKREQELNQVFKSQITEVEKYKNSINETIDTLQRLQNSSTFTKNASNPQVAEEKNKISALIAEYQKLITQLNGNVTPAGLEDINNRLNELNARFNDTTATAQRFEQSLKDDNGAEKLAQRVALLKAQLEALAKANPKALKQFGNEINSLMATLNNNPDGRAVEQVAKSIQILRKEINNADLAGKTFFQNLKEKAAKFTGWMSMTYAISLATRTIRSMITEVVNLDTALIDLKKTFKGTNSDLQDFYYEANNVAKQLGVTTEEVINSASSWSRLGYNTKEAAIAMSKYASMFKMISPNMSMEDSTDGLLSVMKAFDIEVNDVLDGIMSKINKVGNEFGTSNNEIVQMLMRSSSAMKEGNNTLAETIALETSAVEITRDYASVGTAYKTLAMRLRGYDEELETYSNDVQVLSGEIANLTKTAKNPNGVSLFKDEAKTEYKSTLEILRDIREVYDDLDDKTQAQLLEKIAGKRQGQIVAATLSNWDTVEKALVAMENADGSALNEMNTIMESISYRANIFKETLVGIAQGLFSQDFMKSMVDSGTRVLTVFDDLTPIISFLLEQIATLLEFVTKLADTIGGIPILIAGIGLKNVGSPKMFGLVLICQQ